MSVLRAGRLENLEGKGFDLGGLGSNLVVENIAELRTNNGAGQAVQVLGYYESGDGGGGPLRVWKTDGPYVDNGGSIIVPTGGDGSGAWVWEYSGAINVKWFGAVGDYDPDTGTGADDTIAIKAAITYCEDNGLLLSGGGIGTYFVSETLQIIESCDFSNCVFYAEGTTSPVFLLGSEDSSTQTFSKTYKMPKVYCSDKPYRGWDSGSVGIRYANLYSCVTYTPRVSGFEIGEWYGGSRGHAYNEHHHEMPYGNKVNVLLQATSATGWVNENTFYGGRHGCNSSDTTDWSDTRNLKLTNYPGSTGVPNNNLFIKPSIESNSIEYQLELSGTYNTFLNARYEGNGKVLLKAEDGIYTQYNEFVGGYDTRLIKVTVSKSGTGSVRRNNIVAEVIKNEASGYNVVLKNTYSDKAPHIIGFGSSSENALLLDHNSTDWRYRLSADYLEGKDDTDDYAATRVDFKAGRFYFGDGSADPSDFVGRHGTLSIGVNKRVVPITNNEISCGAPYYRWSEIFAGTGVINTSDAREKTFLTIDEAEKAAALEIKANLRKFKFNNAIEAKGEENARIHFGASAQQVGEILSKHGLSPEQYAFYCYDEWDAEFDKNGNEITAAGNCYGIRYEELLCFIMAAI